MLIWPGLGLIIIIWIIAIWAIVSDITLIVLGVQLRKAAHRPGTSALPAAGSCWACGYVR